MVYDTNRFLLRDLINGLIPVLREDFLNAHGMDTSNIPMYDVGKELDIHRKWKMSVLKIMGEWDTEAKVRYPNFNKFIEGLGDVCRSAGYSILEPGGNVVTHTDTEEGHENYVIVHVPLIVPEGDVGFFENDEKGKWVEGECFILDVESPHSIWNNTDKSRLVILLELLKKDVYV
jgi:aspartyl/asparaginyl beta-hydroxylase (cupin superfamily)